MNLKSKTSSHKSSCARPAIPTFITSTCQFSNNSWGRKLIISATSGKLHRQVPTQSLIPPVIPTSPATAAPSINILRTFSPNNIPHSSISQTRVLFTAPTSNVVARLELVSPMSSELWLNPDSLQYPYCVLATNCKRIRSNKKNIISLRDDVATSA